MDVLLLEDDPIQADEIIETLEEKLGIGEGKILLIESESDFREALPRIRLDQPKVAVLDIRVIWSVRDDERPESESWEPRRAGIRCLQLLRTDFPKLPIILYSVLTPEDLSDEMETLRADTNVHILFKSNEWEELAEQVGSQYSFT
jgi:DNA-binding NarL/FixJ family response regulator